MATPDDIAFLDATAQAELVRQKEVQPIELVARFKQAGLVNRRQDQYP